MGIVKSERVVRLARYAASHRDGSVYRSVGSGPVGIVCQCCRSCRDRVRCRGGHINMKHGKGGIVQQASELPARIGLSSGKTQ